MFQKKEKKCNCENDSDNTINYLVLGGIGMIIYLIYKKKC